MMNSNISFLKIVSLSLLFTAFSCSDDFLEVTPKGSLIAQTTEDYNRLLDDPDLRELSNVAVPMGDEVVAINPYFSNSDIRTRRLFAWEDDIYNSDQNSDELQTAMRSVYSYNKIINEVTGSSGGTEREKIQLEAEARIGRALYYFHLVNYYGKPYDMSTASSDPGFPIIEFSTINDSDFTRNTVGEVYDFIVEDILTALPDLETNVYERTRLSRAAGEALLGKVLMFQHNYEQALEHLELAIDYTQNAEVGLALYDYNQEFMDGGVFTPVNPFFGPAYPTPLVNSEVVFAVGYINNWAFVQNELAISQETSSLFNSADLRLNFYTDTEVFGFAPFYPNGILRKVGPLRQQAGILLPDILLLRAEAKARLNQLAEATEELEEFRATRMPGELASVPQDIAGNREQLVAFILDERLREFALSGFRWFDMRRLSVDPEFNDLVTYEHRLYNPEGEILETFILTEDRLTLRFGGQVTSQNPNLIENP